MSKHWDTPFGPSEVICKESLHTPETCKENPDSFTSLEEAARLYAIPHYTKDIDVNHIEEYPYDSGLEAAFIAGAEWMKSKMMEGAVEGRVFMSFAPGHNQMVMADVDLPTNTKVRIVVLKEEEE